MNKVIFWDFDGVIANTFMQAFGVNRLSHPTITESEYRQRFEGNINHTQHITPPVKKIDFFAEYEKTIFDANLMPHFPEIISHLQTDFTNIIVSSTISSLIDNYLSRNGVRHYFTDILGNDISHSKVEKFKLGFKNHTTSPAHSLLITDTLGDIREANQVNLPTTNSHPRPSEYK